MGIPSVKDWAPTNLTPYSATYKAQCYPNGGYPCYLKFYSLSFPNEGYHISQLFDITEEGQIVEWTNNDLNYKSSCWYHSHIQNDDGLSWTKSRMFWLPIPSSINIGSPWLITVKTGTFDDWIYNLWVKTDVACTLHVLVGTTRPIIKPEGHITHGVVFHHDPRIYFKWNQRVNQHEEGDVTSHTFAIPYAYEDVKYWVMAVGSVDGKDSPSVSPPFWFRRYSVPTMRVSDATNVTKTTAEIHGQLFNDKGAPAYVRMRYTKEDEYTDYTAKTGPHGSKFWWNEHITDLDPDTEYKFGSIGSHDQAMVRYGWSQPKYFTTLGPVYVPACGSTEWTGWLSNLFPGQELGARFKPVGTFNADKFSLQLSRWDAATDLTEICARIYHLEGTAPPTTDPIAEDCFTATLPHWPLYETHEFKFDQVQLIAGENYLFSVCNCDKALEILLLKGTTTTSGCGPCGARCLYDRTKDDEGNFGAWDYTFERWSIWYDLPETT